MDYRTGLMQSIMDLGTRSLADPYSPIPNWDPGQQQGGGDERIARLREMLQSGNLNQNQRSRIRDRIQGLR
jgi:Spy/CpxP family protein refolding chaperone